MTNVLLTGSLESFIQLLGALFIFAVVLAATYLTTRWMGGMQRGRQNNKNLHVIETISVGNNKMISIVEVGSVYLVVSVGKEEVHLLAQLTRDQLKDFSFDEHFDFAIFSAGAETSRHFAPIAASKGCVVIDNSSAFNG